MLNEQDVLPEAQRIFNLNTSTPRLILKPRILRGSFLDPPVGEGDASSTGIWPSTTRFPKGIIPYKTGFAMKPLGGLLTFLLRTRTSKDF